MDCSRFRDQHLAYLDDTLPGDVMRAARQHLAVCTACAAHDGRIRRSLMLAHNHVTEIEPSSDFRARLDARLAACAAERRASTAAVSDADAPLVTRQLVPDAFVLMADESDSLWRRRTTWLAMAAGVAVVSLASLGRSGGGVAEPALRPIMASAPRPPAPPAPSPAMVPATPGWAQPRLHELPTAAFIQVGTTERSVFVR